MLSLSPAKLLVVLVVALIVLGPDKLPKVARQLGAAWHDLRKLRERLEGEVRGAFPDLPSTHHVAQAVRSPLAYLDGLADKHAAGTATGAEGAAAGGDAAGGEHRGEPPPAGSANGNGSGTSEGDGSRTDALSLAGWDEGPEPRAADDPSMN